MNRVRQQCATTLLAVVMAASTVLAGDMPGGITSPPPLPTGLSVVGKMPAGVTASTDASVTGDTSQEIAAAIDPVTESMLGLLQSVLWLF